MQLRSSIHEEYPKSSWKMDIIKKKLHTDFKNGLSQNKLTF